MSILSYCSWICMSSMPFWVLDTSLSSSSFWYPILHFRGALRMVGCMVALNQFPDAFYSIFVSRLIFCIRNIYTCEKLLLIRAIDRSCCIIWKCPSLTGTAMTVVWTSTMSPIRKCAGVVEVNLVLQIWVDVKRYNIELHTVVKLCFVAYSIKPYCHPHESRYPIALKTKFLSDLHLVRMGQCCHRDLHVVMWSSKCQSLWLGMW